MMNRLSCTMDDIECKNGVGGTLSLALECHWRLLLQTTVILTIKGLVWDISFSLLLLSAAHVMPTVVQVIMWIRENRSAH